MINKSFRIPKNDIKFIMDKGDTIHGLFFIAKIKENFLHPRATVIASKKLEKKAVKRNKIRRRTYEAFRINLKEIENPPKKDFVFITKKSILNAEFEEIKKDISKILSNEQNQQTPN